MEGDIVVEIEGIVVTGNRETGEWRFSTPDGSAWVVTLSLQPKTYKRADGTDTGVEMTPEDVADVTILKLLASMLDQVANLPFLTNAQENATENLSLLLNTAALNIEMQNAGDTRDAVLLGFKSFWSAVDGAFQTLVVSTMLGVVAASATQGAGPLAVAGGLGLSALAGWMISENFPDEELAEVSTDFVFWTGERLGDLERDFGHSFNEIMNQAYREVMDVIYGGQDENVPRPFYVADAAQLKSGAAVVWDGDVNFNSVSWATAAAAVTIDLAIKTQMIAGQLVTLNSVEGVIGSAFDDTLVGNAFRNRFEGGAGNDYIDGREGFDEVDYRSATGSVAVNLNLTTQNTGQGTDTLVSIEGVNGSGYSDTLTGNSADNLLIGGLGNDALYGGAGDDLIVGHGRFSGRSSTNESDAIDGGAGFDRISFEPWTMNVFRPEIYPAITVDLTAGTTSWSRGRGTVTSTLVSIEGVTGGNGHDHLVGSSAANELIGLGGQDFIDGGSGDDYIDGGSQNDTLLGGAGFDTLSYLSAYNGAVINLNNSVIEGDTVSGFEAAMGSQHDDIMTGTSAANHLFGAGGNDVIVGDGGADLVVGGFGADQLTGGTGNDTFRFLSYDDFGHEDLDHITDFAAGDFIDLSALDADTEQAGDQAFVWTSSFTGESGQIRMFAEGPSGRARVELDWNGDGVADASFLVDGTISQSQGWIL